MNDKSELIDEVLEKLKKDLKFHKKGLLSAKSIVSEHHYNDILKSNFKEAKATLQKAFREAQIEELTKLYGFSDNGLLFPSEYLKVRLGELREAE